MFLKSKLFSSIPIRLATLYSLIFAFLFGSIFTVVYFWVENYIREIEDQWLVQEAKQILEGEPNFEELAQRMKDQANAYGNQQIFYCLRNQEGVSVVQSSSSTWQEIVQETSYFVRKEKNLAFEFVTVGSRTSPVRNLYYPLKSGMILQVSYSLQNSSQFLNRLLSLSYYVFPLTIIIFWCLGFFMLKGTLKPMQIMTQIAQQVSADNLKKRIPLSGSQNELDELAHTLNQMLDKISNLVSNIQEMCENLAHDVRTPITRIQGIAEVALLKERAPHEYPEVLQDCLTECERLLSLLNTILDISEVEARIIAIKKERISLSSFLEDIIEMFEDIAQHQGVQLTYTPLPQDCFISGDRRHLQRAIINLLDNAIKYTKKGEVVVKVEEQDSCVCISIKDTGIGIKEKDLPQIFRRFYRSDSSRSLPGAGLGLSLANAIISAHAGTISVQSQVGQGSLFQVQLKIS